MTTDKTSESRNLGSLGNIKEEEAALLNLPITIQQHQAHGTDREKGPVPASGKSVLVAKRIFSLGF